MANTASDSTLITFTQTDLALIDAYKALGVFVLNPAWRPLLDEHDPKARDQALEAIDTIEKALPVPVLLTILPTYTKVRFTINGGTAEGQLREGAWGLYARGVNEGNRERVYARRITTTTGFETWIGPDTVLDKFEILERPNT